MMLNKLHLVCSAGDCTANQDKNQALMTDVNIVQIAL